MNLSRLLWFCRKKWSNPVLSKNDIQQLFESLKLLNRLTEDCFASDARDSRICHHLSDAQTDAHECDMAAAAASFSDSHQTTADAIPDERPPTSRAARTPNAHETARVRPNGKIIWPSRRRSVILSFVPRDRPYTTVRWRVDRITQPPQQWLQRSIYHERNEWMPDDACF